MADCLSLSCANSDSSIDSHAINSTSSSSSIASRYANCDIHELLSASATDYAAQLLGWLSSAEAPVKIVQFVLPYLQQLQAFKHNNNCNGSAASAENSCDADFLFALLIDLAVVRISTVLLRPFTSKIVRFDTDSALTELFELLNTSVLSLLTQLVAVDTGLGYSDSNSNNQGTTVISSTVVDMDRYSTRQQVQRNHQCITGVILEMLLLPLSQQSLQQSSNNMDVNLSASNNDIATNMNNTADANVSTSITEYMVLCQLLQAITSSSLHSTDAINRTTGGVKLLLKHAAIVHFDCFDLLRKDITIEFERWIQRMKEGPSGSTQSSTNCSVQQLEDSIRDLAYCF